VASITNTGAMSSFSNYGATTVDIGAPGSGIWSTVPTSSGGSGYSSMSGTSMATPHVTGAVALYKARNPSATASQIKAAILNSATPTSSLSGRVVTGGRLNVSGF
jgi:subtilisin family serine protease